MSRVNVNGGALLWAIPMAPRIVTLLYQTQRRAAAKRGLATLCIGGGMGTANIFEKC